MPQQAQQRDHLLWQNDPKQARARRDAHCGVVHPSRNDLAAPPAAIALHVPKPSKTDGLVATTLRNTEPTGQAPETLPDGPVSP